MSFFMQMRLGGLRPLSPSSSARRCSSFKTLQHTSALDTRLLPARECLISLPFPVLVQGNGSTEFLDRPQRLQNRVARIITKSSLEIKRPDILDRLHWDSLSIRRFKNDMMTAFKAVNHSYLQHTNDQFIVLNHSDKYRLRGCYTKIALPPKKKQII